MRFLLDHSSLPPAHMMEPPMDPALIVLVVVLAAIANGCIAAAACPMIHTEGRGGLMDRIMVGAIVAACSLFLPGLMQVVVAMTIFGALTLRLLDRFL
jgi:hypothetical protein